VGRTLAEMRIKPEVLLAAVVRAGTSFLPDGGTSLMPGDRVVVVTTNRGILDLDDILAR
jgi:trk system potassium uptake protein TrkA